MSFLYRRWKRAWLAGQPVGVVCRPGGAVLHVTPPHGREPRETDVLTPMTVDEVAAALKSMPPEAKAMLVATEGCDGCLGSVLAVRLVREDGCKPYVLIAREGVAFHPESTGSGT